MTADPKCLAPGDQVPPITLTQSDGRQVNLAHQSRAGRATVLAFASAAVLEGAVGKAAAAIEALERAEGAFHAVTAEAKLARQLTGSAEGIAVLSPSARLAAIFPPGELADALEFARRLQERMPPRPAVMQAPVLLIDQVLEPELCTAAIDYWEAGEKSVNAVSRGSGRDGRAAAAKRRTDVIVQDGPLFTRLKDRLARRVLPEMYKAFRTRIVSMEALRIGCYESADGGAFARHRDNTTPQTAHRGFAVSLNLNERYEGGAVRFPEYDRAEFAPEPGSALIFSCALLHEALPVTSGRRFALFTFLNDAEGAAMERRRLQQQQK